MDTTDAKTGQDDTRTDAKATADVKAAEDAKLIADAKAVAATGPQSDAAKGDAATADATAASKADAQMMEVRATGSFHEQAGFQGRLLQAGDTFSTDRGRAAELRASGLVTYVNADEEKKAAENDPPPSENNGTVAITTRSIRRSK